MDEDEDYTCDLTEEELFELTENLLENDENNCARYFRYNFQERRCGQDDVCEEPLFSDVDEELFEIPTIKALMALHDNYIPIPKYNFHVHNQVMVHRFRNSILMIFWFKCDPKT